MKTYFNLLDAAKEFSDKACFLFDMDGLLFDTEQLFMEQLAVVMAEYGYRLTKEVYEQSLGLGGTALRNLMCGIYGEDYPFLETGQESRRRVSVIAETVGLRIKPQIPQLLQWLQKNQKICAVASSTSSEFVNKYLVQAELRNYFSNIIGGEMVQHSKPEPEIFLLASEECGVNPEDTVVLEDSENGIRAAYAAGMSTLCIPDLKMPSREVCDLIDVMVLHHSSNEMSFS